mgnify:CR=1 FL=1
MTTSAPASTASRDAVTVTAWNVVSRVTGLARVIVLGGALGATRLADTYQASNQISNVLFELLAAGTLSAVLVPGLVARIARNDVDAARAFAGLVLGRVLLIVTPLVVVGVVFAKPLMRIVFTGNSGASHDVQVRLGVFLLFFVLPQLVLYAFGALITALLHAAGRFAAAAVAPVANNLVVIAGLGWFWARGGEGLDLSVADRWLLGATALGGVAAMTLVPSVAAWRAGLGVVPRLGHRAERTGIGADALWASLVLLPAQVVAFGSIVVAGHAAGGVAAYQIAFTFFLLPHALVGHPTATVLYPRLAAAFVADDKTTMRRLSADGLEVIISVLSIAGACAAALSPWLVRVVAVGELESGRGAALTATALAWLAIGLPSYAGVLLLSRVSFAGSDLKVPAYAAMLGAAGAVGVLGFASTAQTDGSTVALVAIAHSVMVTIAATIMLVATATSGVLELRLMGLIRYVGAAVIAGGVARFVANSLPDGEGRAPALAIVVGAAAVGIVVYALGLVAMGQRSRPRLAAA